MGRLFGTDGVRGVANADLTPELALSLALAAARELVTSERPRAVVGRDPRISGEMLEAAVVAGLVSAGVDVLRVGVLPTPGVAWLTTQVGADVGVMLSASHNAMPDNGVKFFDGSGHKLSDEVEDAIEARLGDTSARPTGGAVGRVRDDEEGVHRYVDHLVASTDQRLDGVRVVVDAANGAASWVSPEVLRRLGADVTTLHSAPDGLNINAQCGSTHPEDLQSAVLRLGADVGIAHDGDADRCLAVDGEGELVDGDQMLAVCAIGLQQRGELRGNTVVTTVMANLGFSQAMRAAGIQIAAVAVGDRYVLEEMRTRDLVLGGEQSGHLIFLDRATTGDGVLSAVRLLSRMAETGQSLRDLASVMRRLPQVLVNVRVADRTVASAPAVVDAVAAAEAELGAQGRVLLRPSGTEPLVRVMVEAPDQDTAQRLAEAIAAVVAESATR